MKKGIFIILVILSITSLAVWFACNPFQQNVNNRSLNFNVLDDTSGSRLAISTTIDINGATWDGGGGTVQQVSGNPICNGSQCEGCCGPFFRITNGTLKNCTMAPPTAEGIWIYGGTCAVDNVTAPDIGEDIITVKKAGTITVSNCTFNLGMDKVIQINDLCTITTQNVKADTAIKFMRQNGGKTWKMVSYSNDCTVMNMSECVFRSDSPASTFYYHNLTTNCGTIGYSITGSVATHVVPN
jgi:pectate lyase C